MTIDLTIPDFLRRELTPEAATRIKRLTAIEIKRAAGRLIRNPRRRARKTGLGTSFENMRKINGNV